MSSFSMFKTPIILRFQADAYNNHESGMYGVSFQTQKIKSNSNNCVCFGRFVY